MLEVNAIYFILLLEGFVLSLVLLLVWLLVTLVRRRRGRKTIADFATAIKGRSAAHRQQTESFLQVVYQLQGDDLRNTLADIDKHETDFFQHLIQCLYRGDKAQIKTLDMSLDKLIKSYKCMQPKVEIPPLEQPEVVQEITTLRGENDMLKGDLSIAQNKISDLITEFGEIFGGGKDHQLTLQEVIDKVDAMKADHDSATAVEAQK
ncbi:MAG: hypothetical protein KJN95_02750 [Gammaproteobacteria bacterium]|nr:hypothetical protein [Gammaproteobacteria bacterium]